MADRPDLLSRRQAMGLLAGVGAGVIAAACGGGSSSKSASSSTTTRTTSAGASGTTASTAACVLTPEVTEGPYYLDLDKVRSDITEGKEGALSGTSFAAPIVTALAAVAYQDSGLDRAVKARQTPLNPKSMMLAHLLGKNQTKKLDSIYGYGLIKAPERCGVCQPRGPTEFGELGGDPGVAGPSAARVQSALR